jgi:CheY-like chemotaxis protein
MYWFEATAAIRDRERPAGARTPIIAMTAHAGPEYAEKCHAAGLDGYVTKPIDPPRLFAAIRPFSAVCESSSRSLK